MALVTNNQLSSYWCGCEEIVRAGDWEVETDPSNCIYTGLQHPSVELLPPDLTPLEAVLHTHAQADHRWHTTRTEPDRIAARAAWGVPIASNLAIRWTMDGNRAALNTGSQLWETFRTNTCTPSALNRDRRHLDLSTLEWLGICTGCGWVANPAITENDAVEDAHDHSHPGWRNIPVIASPRHIGDGTKPDTRWIDLAYATYGTEWLANSGPVRTRRQPMGTRHVSGRAPGGGYDLSGGTQIQTTQSSLF